jgi:hypothetical protein
MRDCTIVQAGVVVLQQQYGSVGYAVLEHGCTLLHATLDHDARKHVLGHHSLSICAAACCTAHTLHSGLCFTCTAACILSAGVSAAVSRSIHSVAC